MAAERVTVTVALIKLGLQRRFEVPPAPCAARRAKLAFLRGLTRRAVTALARAAQVDAGATAEQVVAALRAAMAPRDIGDESFALYVAPTPRTPGRWLAKQAPLSSVLTFPTSVRKSFGFPFSPPQRPDRARGWRALGSGTYAGGAGVSEYRAADAHPHHGRRRPQREAAADGARARPRRPDRAQARCVRCSHAAGTSSAWTNARRGAAQLGRWRPAPALPSGAGFGLIQPRPRKDSKDLDLGWDPVSSTVFAMAGLGLVDGQRTRYAPKAEALWDIGHGPSKVARHGSGPCTRPTCSKDIGPLGGAQTRSCQTTARWSN